MDFADSGAQVDTKYCAENYPGLLENIPDGVGFIEIVFDKCGKPIDCIYRDVNKSFTEQTGITPETILNRSCSELFQSENDANDWLSLYGNVAVTGEPVRLEKYSAGTDRYFALSAYRISPKQVVAVFRDITREKQAQAALRESERRMNLLMESAEDIIVMQDAEARYLYYNGAGRYGLDSEAVLEKTPYELFESPVADRIEKRVKEVFATGQSIAEESQWTWQGETLWFSEQVYPIRNESGNVFAVLTISRNVTELRRIEIENRRMQEHFSGIFNASKDAMGFADLDGTLRDVNPAFCELTMYSKQELVGQRYRDITPEECQEWEAKIIERIVRTGKAEEYEKEYIRKDGSRVPVALTTFVVKETENCPARIAAIIRDISERKRTQAKMLVYQKKLRSLASRLSLAEHAERHRIAKQVHDGVGQNLAICSMKLVALLQNTSCTELVKPLNEIRSLIKNIIEQTRSLSFELCSPLLHEMGLEAAMEQLAEQICGTYGIAHRFASDGQQKRLDDDVAVVLYEAVREVLVNVAKHARANNVMLLVKKEDRNVTITVADDGIGFQASEMGSQWHKTDGYGLFSIRERLSYLGGRIAVQSEPSQGCRVTIVAPLTATK